MKFFLFWHQRNRRYMKKPAEDSAEGEGNEINPTAGNTWAKTAIDRD